MCWALCCGVLFFFFKQKTAYDMRISDWSSDVCSSDLDCIHWILGGRAKSDDLDACAPYFDRVARAYTIGEAGPRFAEILRPHMAVDESGTLDVAVTRAHPAATPGETVLLSPACAPFDQFRAYAARGDAFRKAVERSEEQPSALQSLMRHSSAAF